MSKSISVPSPTSIMFCTDGCPRHPSQSVSRGQFLGAISGRTGFIFEHLNKCAIEFRNAQMGTPHPSWFSSPSFCAPVMDAFCAVSEGIRNVALPRAPISLESRLICVVIARQVRKYQESPWPGADEHCLAQNRAKLEEGEKTYLTYPSWDHGSDNLCRIPGLERTLPSLSQEQRRAITLAKGTSPTTISEPMARKYCKHNACSNNCPALRTSTCIGEFSSGFASSLWGHMSLTLLMIFQLQQKQARRRK